MGSAASRYTPSSVRRRDGRHCPQRRAKHGVILPLLRSFTCGASSSRRRAQGKELGSPPHPTVQGTLNCGNISGVAAGIDMPSECSPFSEISGLTGKKLHRLSCIDGTSTAAAISLQSSECDTSSCARSSSAPLDSNAERSCDLMDNEVNCVLRDNRQSSSFSETSGSTGAQPVEERDSSKDEIDYQEDDVPNTSAGSPEGSETVSQTYSSQRYGITQVLGTTSGSFDRDTSTFEYGDAVQDAPLSASELVPMELSRSASLATEQRVVSGNNVIGNSAISSSEDVGIIHVEAFGLIAESSGEASSSPRGDISVREARRNNRRRLWDALTRATSRRRASEDIDGLGASNNTWSLFDWSSGPDDESVTDSGHLFVGRGLETEERRWRVRSQVWALQRLSSGFEGDSGNSRPCATGVHADGRCSCEAFVMTEEPNTRASISRIVMLAEALFEVLDEIHRQSVALSRSTSLSLLSLPAPDSVVNSFPLRLHKKSEKIENANEEAAQCYICLIEYEEGDHVRVLPCKHEYHMACVDKWLKEVHRVCPLCRGNVCESSSRNARSAMA